MITANVVDISVGCGALLRAAAEGLKRHGVTVRLSSINHGAGDFTVCWGMRRAREHIAARRRVLVMERGYVGDRMHWTSLAWDGLNGRGNFCLPDGAMPERFARHFTMQDWRQDGEFVMIAGQVPRDASLQGRDLAPWYAEAAEAATAAYRLPVRFRPHPVAVRKRLHRPGAGGMSGPLEAALERCAVVVTWNSNTAVDAVLAGVPAVTMDPGAMAWPVTAHAIGELARPDRTEWANRLSWCQWSPEELAAGDWWERMKTGLEAS
jgi:hypothetical protein